MQFVSCNLAVSRIQVICWFEYVEKGLHENWWCSLGLCLNQSIECKRDLDLGVEEMLAESNTF